MIWIKLLLIAFMVVFIVDQSGIIDSIKYGIWKLFVKVGDYHNIPLKPFSCSLCSTFWSCIIYLLIVGQFTIPTLAFTCLLAFLTPQIKELQNLIADTLQTLLNLFYKLIGLIH